jgi:hypothetical protein
MRRRKDECTPPTHENAFHPQLLDELRRRDPSPAAPDGDFAGPWRVTRLWGDGPPLWACHAAGERTPRLTFEEPDLAYLAAAALAVAERRPRFRFQEDEEGREHLLQDGEPVANTRGSGPPSESTRPALANTTLATDLTRLHDLRLQPTALAHLLLSVPDEVLERAGTLFLDELRRGRQAEGGER